VNAVSANDGIGVGPHAISEIKPDTAVSALFERDELMIEPQHAIRHDAGQGGVEIAAVRQQVRCAITLLGGFAEDHVEANLASIEVPVIPGAGIERGRAQFRLKSKGAQDFHRVKTDLNAGSDTSEAPSLLIDGDVDTDPPQRCRGRKSAHSRADDRNGKPFHVGMP